MTSRWVSRIWDRRSLRSAFVLPGTDPHRNDRRNHPGPGDPDRPQVVGVKVDWSVISNATALFASKAGSPAVPIVRMTTVPAAPTSTRHAPLLEPTGIPAAAVFAVASTQVK